MKSDKLALLQAVTRLDDPDLCTEILTAHNCDVEQAISTITSSENPENTGNVTDSPELIPDHTGPPGLVLKRIALPISIVSASLGLVSGGELSYSFSLFGLSGSNANRKNESSEAVNNAICEAVEFVRVFEREYGARHPNFVREGFMDALQRSLNESKLLFVYLHSPDHPDTRAFCQGSLCDEAVERFLTQNFVAWGGSISASEGFAMSDCLKASMFLFCAVVMGATNQTISLLQQVEGPKAPEEMLTMLERLLEESAPVLVTSNNIRSRDAAYQAALEADQDDVTNLCEICFEWKYLDQLFSEGCDHIYCCDCINHHIEAKLCLGMMPKCPAEGCNVELKLDDCINIVAPHVACLMKQMVKEAMIPVTEKFYCPYQSCSTLMTKTEADQLPKSTSGATKCAKCGREFCYSCGVQWHKNMSCVDYQNGVQSYDKVHIMGLLIDDTLSQCRKCNQGIEKVAGCNHMTCRCGHEFCFICEVEWKNCRCPVFSSEDSGNHFEDEPDVDENEEREYREYHYDTSMDY